VRLERPELPEQQALLSLPELARERRLSLSNQLAQVIAEQSAGAPCACAAATDLSSTKTAREATRMAAYLRAAKQSYNADPGHSAHHEPRYSSEATGSSAFSVGLAHIASYFGSSCDQRLYRGMLKRKPRSAGGAERG
jgi:spore germination cell wall hydrolase CwlJ-like protein